MLPMTTFDSGKLRLLDLLTDIANGKIQLPDFQRGWVWDDEHLRSLLASISTSYPIGAIMLLETGNEEMKFKPRLVEGVKLTGKLPAPEFLILDGQQRLTSLSQALSCVAPVKTRDARGNEIERWYYIDIAKSLNNDREDAIIGVPAERIIRGFQKQLLLDVSSSNKEYELGFFPLSRVSDCTNWRSGYNEFWDYDKAKSKLWDTFEKDVIKRFEQYLVPAITIKKETPKDAVCQVFEKVNTGGVPLTVFELLTASFAADNFNLREDWESRQKVLKQYKALRHVQNTDFLQAVSLLTTRERRIKAIAEGTKDEDAPGISCKRKDVLKLTLKEYKHWADTLTDSFKQVAKFLFSQKMFDARDLPYQTQLVPLAAIFAAAPKNKINDTTKAKIARWFWCGVFGELYSGAIESRFAKDLPEVLEWLDGGGPPDTVEDANFAASRLLSLRTRNSAAYKGLSALLLRDGGQDFLTGDSVDLQLYFDEKIDIHHIFPQKWTGENGVNSKSADCIVNKTPLSARTNRVIGGRAPSKYLGRIEKKANISASRLDEILESHVIDPKSLRDDDFDKFFEKRRIQLLKRIEHAMGKPVAEDMANAKNQN